MVSSRVWWASGLQLLVIIIALHAVVLVRARAPHNSDQIHATTVLIEFPPRIVDRSRASAQIWQP